jgi:hypothetical protein
MTIYPDTSFLVALRFFDDTHHASATDYFAAQAEETFLWSPWHRVEVSNALRQFARGDQPVLRETEARRICCMWRTPKNSPPTCSSVSTTIRCALPRLRVWTPSVRLDPEIRNPPPTQGSPRVHYPIEL